jgi:hypothetical protein
MKFALTLLLAIAVTVESVVEPFLGHPYIEHGLNFPLQSSPAASGFAFRIGGSAEPLGHLRQRLLYDSTRSARLSKDRRAILNAFPNAARSIVAERFLQLWERQMTYQMLAVEIRSTRKDYRAALPAIASALDLQPNPVLNFSI